MNVFFKELVQLIENSDENKIVSYIEKHKSFVFADEEAYEMIDYFSCNIKNNLRHCINLCGTGGSGIVKPNITSISSLYLAYINSNTFVKTGSIANSGKFGSSDFFNQIGIINYTNKMKIIEEFGWGYFDYLELSPWKQYKPILKLNDCFRDFFDRHIIYDYSSKHLILGISNPIYHKAIDNHIQHYKPQKIHTYYTETSVGIIDEFAPGNIYVDGQLIRKTRSCEFNYINDINEIKQINLDLINGCCNRKFWKESLLLTITMVQCILNDDYFSFDDYYRNAKKVYEEKKVKKHINKIKDEIIY